MQYMLLIYDDEQLWAGMKDEERGAIMEEYFAFTRAAQEAGVYVDGAPLQPTQTAKTVRVREGGVSTTDGPFAETKEQLGGYYLVDVDSAEDAIAWAQRIPSARLGSIEVRPVQQIPAGAEAHA